MVRLLIAIGLSGGLLFTSVAPAEAALQYRVQPYDPYSPSTPYLYRRERRSTACQLSPSLRGKDPPANQFQGWLLPGLIWGNCPLRMEMMGTKDEPRSIFGPTGR